MPAKVKPVKAAGGVVWRIRDGAPEVAIVHRPRYDDWTLPKGKAHEGEPDLLAAVREVREELGAEVVVQQRLGRVAYDTDAGPKRVTYWAMRHAGGEFAANAEVDEIRWLRVGRAHTSVSYAGDRAMLEAFDAAPVADSTLLLVRHALAGKRTEWDGDDALRPLDADGQVQAHELVGLLGVFGPTRVYAASLTRCVQTVEPLAAALGVAVAVEPAFADEAYDDSPTGTHTRLLALAQPGHVSVVCAQGFGIPALIDRLGPGIRSSQTAKGAWWVLTVIDGEVVATDPYHAP